MANIGVIELDNPLYVADDEGSIVEMEDGSTVVDDDPVRDAPRTGAQDHRANLAEHIGEDQLFQIAEYLIDCYENDQEARKEWERRLARGIEVVGFAPQPEDDAPFNGASAVTYPIIAEAVVQFNARALDEIFPAAGPVKTIVVGDKTPEREEQANRVQDYMNYQILEEDPGWQDEDDRLLMRLPLDGHAWKKVYRDERMGCMTSKFVAGHDVFAPYSATATCSIPRLCHRYFMQPNDVLFEQRTGNWRMCDLQQPRSAGEEERSEVQHEIDQAEGSAPGTNDKDFVHTILEFYVDYDLPGFEHISDEDGEPTGFALPYICIVDLDSRKVLKIVRNWREGDERYRKRINLVPYRFLPGLGFYGYGYLHVIGGLNEAATGALRSLLDSAAFANLQGGFLTKDARIKGEALELSMGEWKPIDASAEEVMKAFYTPPRHPPSDAMFKLLEILIEAGKSFTSTTEAMTGSASSTGPVGTMVALIEQGSKVFSGIHKRLHKSKRDEYRLLAELNAEHLPAEGYPYEVGNASRMIMGKDFGPEVDVLPVSDPNIHSAQQRIAIAQAQLELATTNPDLYDRREAHRRMLEALNVPDIDGILLDNDTMPRLDPVSENAKLMVGQPVRAFPDQQHQAHIAVHMSLMQHAGFGANPEVAKIIGPPMAAHLAEHLAFAYQMSMMQAGVPTPPIQLGGANQDERPEMPPEMEGMIAMRAAAAAQAFLQSGGGLPPPPPDPAQVKAEAEAAMRQQELALKGEELKLKQAATAADLQKKTVEIDLKQQEFQIDQGQKAQAFTAEEIRKMKEWALEQRRLEEEHKAGMKRQEEQAEQQSEIAEQKAEQQSKIAAQQAHAKAQAAKSKPAAKKKGA